MNQDTIRKLSLIISVLLILFEGRDNAKICYFISYLDFRRRLPRTKSYQQRVFQYYQSAMPYQIHQNNNLALVTFKSGAPVFPIFLRKNSRGYWLVDEAMMQGHIHAFKDGKFYFKYKGNPFEFAQKQLPQGHTLRNVLYRNGPSLFPDIKDFDHLDQIEGRLKAEISGGTEEAANYFLLGDFYLFEVFDLVLAEKNYIKGLSLNPNSPYRWRLFDVLINGSNIVAGIEQLEILTKDMDDSNYYRVWLKLLKSVYLKGYDYYSLRLSDYISFRREELI